MNTSNIDYFSFRNVAGRSGRMGKWFIGRVFVLEVPPDPSDMLVEISVDTQPDGTPTSLILGLPEDQLTENSRNTLDLIEGASELSIDTIRENRHIEVNIQELVAERIRGDLVYRNSLNWRYLPNNAELVATCDLIFNEMGDERYLKGNQIYDGRQLAAVLTKLKMAPSIRDFLDDRVRGRRSDETVSEATDHALKFLRSYVCFRLPRQLSAIEKIHRDVLRKAGMRSIADYRHYISLAESIFLDYNVFILDEFGIPYSLGALLRKSGEGFTS